MFAFVFSHIRYLFRPLILGMIAFGVVACGGSGGGILKGGKSSGTTPHFRAKHEAWRGQVETACLRSGVARGSPWIATRSSLGGPSVCGAIRPLHVTAVGSGSVRLSPPATLRCPMVPAMERWMHDVVQPAARRHFGAPVNDLKVAASYGCRPRNNKPGGKLSEHGFANAIDISEFSFANGHKTKVLDWRRGSRRSRAFLREVHKKSCRIFTTVLGPEADKYHQDHFHFDLARHGKRGKFHYCR